MYSMNGRSQKEVITMNDTFTSIQKLSNERQHLFDLGGIQKLSDEQRRRIDEITGRLPGLWEVYRRELASNPGRR
jgi:hypothetical protein